MLDVDKFKKQVGLNIKVARIKAGMRSQADLAEAAGVSEAAIATYEAGTAAPLLETTMKLAKALGVTPNDLCGF